MTDPHVWYTCYLQRITSSMVDTSRETTQPSHSWKSKVLRVQSDTTTHVLECTTYRFMFLVTLSAVLYAIPLGWNIWVAGASRKLLPADKTSVTCYSSVQNILFPLLGPNCKI